MSNLVAHKSSFKLRGIIGGKDDSKIRTGFGVNKRPWKSIRFSIKTSPEQNVYVEKFASEPEKVYAWSKTEKKSMGIDFKKKDEVKLPPGYTFFKTDWEWLDIIIKNFKNGDSVVLIGEFDYQEYNGNINAKNVIKSVYASTEDVDFNAEDFNEIATFSQEMTVNSIEVDKVNNKIYVHVWIFKNRGKEKPVGIFPFTYVVDINSNKKFASTIARFKLGDTFKADGIIINKVINIEVEQDDKYGKLNNQVTKKTISEYQLVGIHADSIQEKLYKEKEILDALEALESENKFKDDSLKDADFGTLFDDNKKKKNKDNENDSLFDDNNDDDEIPF